MKIKPCPFCGSRELTQGVPRIYCKNCNTCGPAAIDGKTITEMWNTRHKKKSKWVANTGIKPENLPEKFKVRLSSKEVIECTDKDVLWWTFTDDTGDIIAWKPMK